METRVFPAKIEHMEAMLSFINEGAKACDFDEKKIFSLRLACEEALVNVINYAYPGKDGELVVTYRIKEGNDLEIEIKDAGIPFDQLRRTKHLQVEAQQNQARLAVGTEGPQEGH